MRMTIHKLTESIVPVVLLLGAIFIVLLFVEYRASQDAERTRYIEVSLQASVQNTPENEVNTVVEIDYIDDPRIVEAQTLIKEGMFTKAEKIYFSILAKEPSAQIHNWLGILYLKQEKYNQAAVSFSSALKIDPYDYRARYNRALAYSALDEFDKAVLDYRLVIQSFDAHVKSHFNLGLLFYRHKEYGAAAEEFKRTASLSSGDTKVKAFYLLGRSYSRMHPQQTEIAIGAYNEAIRLKPDHIASRLALIDLEYPKNEEGQKKRLEALDALLQLEPANVAIYRAMADVYRALEQETRALKILKEALLHEPNNIELQFEVVELLMRNKKSPEAIVALETILAIDPSSTKAYFLLGRLYYLQGAYEDALAAYKKVETIKREGTPELWNNMGLLYAKMKRIGEAKDAYAKALKLRSAYPEVQYNLGLLFLNQKEYAKAEGSFEEAIRLQPKYHQAYYNLALVYTKQQKHRQAIDAYRKSLEIKPEQVHVKLNLAVRYAKIKEFAKAQAIYEEVLDKDSSYFIAWLNLGLVHYQQKAYHRSQEALLQAIALEPDNNKAYRALAKSYSALHNHDESIRILSRLLAQNPSDVRTRLAYARAYYRSKKEKIALREYKKVMRLDPDNVTAIKMIKKIETKKGI